MPEMSSHERWCLRMFISIAMYPAIRSYDEQAFDNMSEESENNNFIIRTSLRPVPSRGMVQQTKKHGNFRPQLGYAENAWRPREWGAKDHLMKDIIKYGR